MEFIIISLFIIGALLGSFYTVVGMRMPVNESIIKPRSHCNHCNHTLKWYELIPIISWIIQNGKCRKCGKKISIVYPVLEIMTGTLFALAFCLYGVSYEFFAMLVIVSLLVVIYVSDFFYYVILDEALIFAYVFILVLKYMYFGYNVFLVSVFSGALMFLFMLVVKFIGDKVFKTESLGGGDIKLAMFFGFALAVRLSFVSLILGSMIAFPYALYCVLSKKDRQIPFGPFLMSGMLMVFILATRINNLIDLLIK